jgi:hypothetical protein
MKLPFRPAPAPRPIVRVVRDAPLNEETLAEAFAACGPEHPLVRAITQELDDLIAQATAQAAAPGMSEHHGPLAHTCGGIEWLTFFRDRLADRLDAGNRPS